MSNGCLPQSQWMITADPNCPGMGGDSFLNAFMSENPSSADAPKDPVLASQAFATEALLGFTPPKDLGTFIGFVAPPTPVIVAPAVAAVAAAPAAFLGGIGALGITASLAIGAPPPVESLTGSGLEPDTGAALAPPSGPPGGNILAFADELPPNWWDIANTPWNPQFEPPSVSEILKTVSDVTAPSKAGNWYNTLQSALNWLSSLGNLSEPTIAPATVPDLSPSGLPGTPATVPGTEGLPEIVVTGDRPARAPVVVADPVFVPGEFPQRGPAPGPSPSVAPARQPGPGPRVSPVPVTTVSPAPARSPVQSPDPVPVPSPVKQPSPVQSPGTPVIVSPIAPVQGPGILPSSPVLAHPIWTPTPIPTLPEEAPNLALDQAQAVKQKDCKGDGKQKKKQKKHARTVCHVGTYRELKSGLIKHATRSVPCR